MGRAVVDFLGGVMYNSNVYSRNEGGGGLHLLTKFRNTVLFFLKCLVIATVTTSFLGVWQNYYTDSLFGGFGNYLVVLTYIVIFVTFATVYDGFKVGIMRVHELSFGMGLAAFFNNALMYVILSLIARRIFNPLPLLFLTAAQVIILILLMYSLSRVYFALYKARRVLAVFDSNSRNDIIKKISIIKERFALAKGVTVDRGFDEIKREIDKFDTVLICDFDPQLKDEVLKYCYSENKRIYLLPSSGDTILNGSYQVQVFDTPVLFLHNGGLSMEQRIIKRVFDIVASSVGIIISGPIMILIALAIKLTDRGPVFFKQPRVTRDQKIFNIYKFRSMKVQTDDEVKKTTVDDDRITAVGKIIRPFRLDELPQLFNILFGDVSVVGPRPEMVELVNDYAAQLPEFNLRHKVKAGLTGYAQIYGKYNTTPQNKLNMDIHYIEHYSFLEDIKLCAMTLKILFVRESTEGFSEKDSKLKNNK